MNHAALSFLSSQVLYSAPTLLVLASGFLAALTYYRRAPAAARLVLLGCVLYGLSAIGGAVATTLLIQAQDAGTLQPQSLSTWMAVVSIFRSLCGAVTFALFLAAAFVGRPAAD